MTTEPPQNKPVLTLVSSAPDATASVAKSMGLPADGKTPSPTGDGDYPLRAVLDIEVSWVSKQTIEQVCHLDVPDVELTAAHRRERRLLGDFGLGVVPAVGALPAAIVLVDKRWFKKQRPELKHLVKLFEKSGGVVPYTPGLPRISDERATPNDLSRSGTPLLAILKAKLTPELTVEDACHLRDLDDDEEPPEEGLLFEHLRLLQLAGLDVSCELFSVDNPLARPLPPAIVLSDEQAFTSTFPELAHLVPRLVEARGVQPYTRGLPRVFKKPGVSPVPGRSPMHLTVVTANPAE